MAGVVPVLQRFRFSGSNGQPLANGTVTVYEAGTTTLTNTWQDAAQTTLNTNPIVLDSNGECLIYLDSAQSYKFVLKNAGGATQWTADNVSGVSSAVSLSASTGAALVGFIQSGTGAIPRTVQAKAREIVSVTDFYANGGSSGPAVDLTGAVDSSGGMNAALTYVKGIGAIAYVGPGTVKCKNLRLDGGTVSFSLVGAGKFATTLKHSDGDGTLLNDDGSPVGYTLQGFTVDCEYSTYNHAGARNGIAIYQSSNITLRDIHITDFKYSACLIYDLDNNGGVYRDNAVIDCSCDGLGVGANGFLFVNMDRCSYLRVVAKGLVNNAFGPGVGVQFKNRCRWGSAVDCYAEDCYVGFGFAGDTLGAVPGPAYNTATNIRAYNCVTGCALTNAAAHNLVTNLYIDQASDASSLDAIDFAENAIGNSLENVTVRNLLAARRVAYFRAGCCDNHVHLASVDNIGVTGLVARFEDTAQYNTVRLSRMTNPRVRTGGIDAMVAFATAADNNSFTYDGYPYVEDATIASDAVVLKNAIVSQELVLDTEGGAGIDDLATITNNFAQEGMEVTLRTNNDGRDVVIKHNIGNILTTTGADYTLANRRSFIVLHWNVTTSKWYEQYRATHA